MLIFVMGICREFMKIDYYVSYVEGVKGLRAQSTDIPHA